MLPATPFREWAISSKCWCRPGWSMGRRYSGGRLLVYGSLDLTDHVLDSLLVLLGDINYIEAGPVA